MKKYLLSAFFAVALLLPWLSSAQSNCDKLRDYTVAAGATGFTSITTITGYADSVVVPTSGIAQITMPFSMVLGSQMINQGDPLYISTNGFMSFTRPTAYNAMPSTRVIAPLATTGSDNFSAGALNIYKKYDDTPGAESLTIEWSNAGFNSSTFNFQVILTKADNGIEFAYGAFVGTPTTAPARTFTFAKKVVAASNEYINFKDNTATVATDTTTISTQYLVLTAAAGANPPVPADYKVSLPGRSVCRVWATDITPYGATIHWNNVGNAMYWVFFSTDSAQFYQDVTGDHVGHGTVSGRTGAGGIWGGTYPAYAAGSTPGDTFITINTLNPYTRYYIAVDGGSKTYSPVCSFTTEMVTLYMHNAAPFTHTAGQYDVEACAEYEFTGTAEAAAANSFTLYDPDAAVTYDDGTAGTLLTLDTIWDANGNVVTKMTASDTTSYYIVKDNSMAAPFKLLMNVKINTPATRVYNETVCDEFTWNITKLDGTTPGFIDSLHVVSGTDLYSHNEIDTLLIGKAGDPFYVADDCEMHILHLIVKKSTTKTIDTTVCSYFELPIVGTYPNTVLGNTPWATLGWTVATYRPGERVNSIWKMGADAATLPAFAPGFDPYTVVAPAALTNQTNTYQNDNEATYDPAGIGDYVYLIANAAGCDSLIVVNLTIKPAQEENVWDTAIAICNATGYYTYMGTQYGDGGTTVPATADDILIPAGTASNSCPTYHKMTIMVGKPAVAAASPLNVKACGEFTWVGGADDGFGATLPAGVGNGVTYTQNDNNAPSNALYRNAATGEYITSNPKYVVKDLNNNLNPAITFPSTVAITNADFVADEEYELALNLLIATYGTDTVVYKMTDFMPMILGGGNIDLPDPTIANVSIPVDEEFLQKGKDLNFGDVISFDTTAPYYAPALPTPGTTPVTGFCDSIIKYTVNVVYNVVNIDDTACMSAMSTEIEKDLSITLTGNSTVNSGVIGFIVPTTLEPTRDTVLILDAAPTTNATNFPAIFNLGTEREMAYNLRLTVLHNVYGYDTVEACGSYTWPADGITYSNPGVLVPNATKTFQRPVAQGCDSVAVLLLNIRPAGSTVAKNFNETACNTYTWSVDGVTYTNDTTVSATAYVDSITHCQILPTLTLHIATAGIGIDEVTVCDAYVWRDGVRYTESTTTPTYVVATTASGECDSQYVLHLTVNYSEFDTIYDMVCRGAAYTSNGFNVPASVFDNRDSYTTFRYDPAILPNGCNKIYELNLTVGQRQSVQVTEQACDSYTWNGMTYTNDVTLVENGTSSQGCDSITTISVVISHSTHDTTTVSACDSYTWSLNNTEYTTSGNYTVSDSVAPCANTHTLILTVNGAGAIVITDSACGQYIWNGAIYTTSGTIHDTLTSASGCDSIVTINFTVRNATVIGGDAITRCGSYTWRGRTFTNDTIVRDEEGDCETVYLLNLTVNPEYNLTENVKACVSYEWGSATLTADGVYTDSLLTVNNCDSIITLTLALGQPFDTIIDVPAGCDSVIYNGVRYTESVNSTTVYPTEYGCDSSTTLNITVNHPFTDYTTVELIDSTDYEFHGTTYTTSGTYIFNVYGDPDLGTCDSTFILILEIWNEGINDVELTNVNVYPNPTTGVINISGAEVIRVEVLDLVGRMVSRFDNSSRVDLGSLAAGAYTLRIVTTDGTMVRRVVKK